MREKALGCLFNDTHCTISNRNELIFGLNSLNELRAQVEIE